MKALDWAALGVPLAMVFASGLAFFLYVPVLVIGAAWMFVMAVLCSLALGVKIGLSLRGRGLSEGAGLRKNDSEPSPDLHHARVEPLTGVRARATLESFAGNAAAN